MSEIPNHHCLLRPQKRRRILSLSLEDVADTQLSSSTSVSEERFQSNYSEWWHKRWGRSITSSRWWNTRPRNIKLSETAWVVYEKKIHGFTEELKTEMERFMSCNKKRSADPVLLQYDAFFHLLSRLLPLCTPAMAETLSKLREESETQYQQIIVWVLNTFFGLQLQPKFDVDEECPICLRVFDDGNQVGELLCSHRFHIDCIYQWLERKKTCPVCRYRLSVV
ncbi:hypothetical protein NE237_010332 [Protea cynaroides]|uniref:RING-type E3 ubiquitin transferase n=1 Tax=Protea cynaroides TaxID=273540 RepID=A0A9Q0KZ38_9MAGN|nr:hypothetical protein NE237_010332 [Protea cynaroides]